MSIIKTEYAPGDTRFAIWGYTLKAADTLSNRQDDHAHVALIVGLIGGVTSTAMGFAARGEGQGEPAASTVLSVIAAVCLLVALVGTFALWRVVRLVRTVEDLRLDAAEHLMLAQVGLPVVPKNLYALYGWMCEPKFAVADIVEWFPVAGDPYVARNFIEAGVPSSVAAQYVVAMDAGESTQTMHEHTIGTMYRAGWSLAGHAALFHACGGSMTKTADMAEAWTEAMPVALAEAYVCAGMALPEAAAFHRRGEDTPVETLRVMAALRG